MVHYIYMLWKGMYFKDKEQVLSLYFVISQLLNSVFSSIKWTFKNIKLTNLQSWWEFIYESYL